MSRLNEISTYMRTELRKLGFNVWTSETPIIPIIGEMMFASNFGKTFEAGVYTNAVIPPAVPQGQSLLNKLYASHTDEHLDRILEAFRKVD